MSAAPLTVMPRRQSLLDLVDDAQAIITTLEGLDECNPDDDAARDALSEALIAKIAGTKTKVDHTASVLASFETAAAAAQLEIRRLKDRAAYFERQSERLEKFVLAVLEASNLAALEGHTSRLQMKKNPPAVEIAEGTVLADEWLTYAEPEPPAITPDKAAIRAALLNKIEIPGCTLRRGVRLVRS